MNIEKNIDNISNTMFVDSGKKGPIVGISAGVHGNEHAGVKALEKFSKNLIEGKIKLKKGQLVLILKGNEKALEENKRFVKHDLNRCINNYKDSFFPEDYEIKRGQEIKKIIDKFQPSYWLDLHTVSANNAKPYLFSGVKGYDFAKNIGIGNIAINWGNASNTEDKPNNIENKNQSNQGVADYVNFIGRNGYTFEAGSHSEKNGEKNSYQAIVNFLLKLGMIEGDSLEKKFIGDDGENKHVHMEYKHIFKGNFEYKNNINPGSFTYFKKGDIIGYEIIDGKKREVKAQMDGYIILPKDPKICIKGKEVFFFGRKME